MQTRASTRTSAKLFVGQLAFEATSDFLRELFSFYGEVLDVNILRDRHTRKHRGVAFVTMGSVEAADQAIRALHNQYFTLPGRALQVSYGRRSANISTFGMEHAEAVVKDHPESNSVPEASHIVNSTSAAAAAAEVTPVPTFQEVPPAYPTTTTPMYSYGYDYGYGYGYGYAHPAIAPYSTPVSHYQSVPEACGEPTRQSAAPVSGDEEHFTHDPYVPQGHY